MYRLITVEMYRLITVDLISVCACCIPSLNLASQYSQENGQVLVRYEISPVVETQLTCIATGEGQDRRSIVITPTPGSYLATTSGYLATRLLAYLEQIRPSRKYYSVFAM